MKNNRKPDLVIKVNGDKFHKIIKLLRLYKEIEYGNITIVEDKR